MKISDIKPVSGPPKAKAVDGTGPDTDAHIPRDRVSVQATLPAASRTSSLKPNDLIRIAPVGSENAAVAS